MTTTISSKGQIVLPVEIRQQLGLSQGDRLSVEPRDDGVFLRPIVATREYKIRKDPKTGLSVAYPVKDTGRRVTAEQIARLNANLF